MSYLGLHITDGTITGENVDPVAALANNYDLIDTKITARMAFNAGSTVNLANAEPGQEIVISDNTGAVSPFENPMWVADSVGVWHKTDLKETWGAWTTIPLTATFVAFSAGRTPQYRISNWGRIELRGTMKPAAGNFTNNVWVKFFDGVVNSASTLAPPGNRPKTSVSTGTSCFWFKTLAANQPQLVPTGAFTNAVLCANDIPGSALNLYVLFVDTSTAPAGQFISINSVLWDKQATGYAGNIT